MRWHVPRNLASNHVPGTVLWSEHGPLDWSVFGPSELSVFSNRSWGIGFGGRHSVGSVRLFVLCTICGSSKVGRPFHRATKNWMSSSKSPFLFFSIGIYRDMLGGVSISW